MNLKLLLPVLLSLTALPAPADTLKLKVSEILSLHDGLSALDGYQKEVPQGEGQPSRIIAAGYKFSAKVKWAVADDLAAVAKVKAVYDAAVLATVKAVSPDGTGEAIDKSPALKARFSDEVRKLQELEKPVDLTLLTREDLNLDVNAGIPGTVLTWLAPILKKP